MFQLPLYPTISSSMVDCTDGYHSAFNGYGYQVIHLGKGKWIADIRRLYPYGYDSHANIVRASNKQDIQKAVTQWFNWS